VLDQERVQRVFKQSDKYTFEEILKAFSNKNYKSEKKIINTVTDVVRSFAIEGHTIIVGRAGHIIANDIKNALHIRLNAPLNFRIEEIQRKDDLSREEAFASIEKIEKERISFRSAIREEKLHEELYDLIINRESFSENEIVDIVELAMEKKGILERVKAKVQYY
jgi:cytidylate kinase